jgi:hypothetical protein
MHTEVDGCMDSHHRVRTLVSRTLGGRQLLLTVEDTYQVDLQGRKLGRNGLAIHHIQGTSTNVCGALSDSGVWDLVVCETICWVRRTDIGEARPRRHTDHDINGAIALERKFEEGKLIIPTEDVTLGRRSLSSGKARKG